MKMEHLVTAPCGGFVSETRARKGDTLFKDDAIVFLTPAEVWPGPEAAAEAEDPDAIRPDLAEMLARQAFGHDENRPEAVARRRKTGQRTVRENVAALVDPGSFIEYGSLAVAAQAQRRSREDLIRNTPGDGVVAGLASVNGDLFDADRARCLVVAYDYTVLAGTQGARNHKKQDRLFAIAERQRLPIVLFAEGGGGRPGDTEGFGVTGLDVPTFAQFARLSGLAPLVGVVSGRCFAGNAALLGCCDVIIATKDSSIGMGGPAMIEGGGLGVVRPDEVGPVGMQVPNGVIDVVVEDEVEAAATAKRYLSYFQGRIAAGPVPDQRRLRRLIPENRLRVYNIRAVVETLADEGSVLELRAAFGLGIVTALVRIEGRPFGLIASNPKHLGGAIDFDAADKAARFLQILRRLRPAGRIALRHAGFHGRAGSGEDGARPPCLPHVRHRREPDGSLVHDRPSQGLWARGAGDGRGRLPRAMLYRVLADRRIRRHGPRRRGAAWLPQGASRD